jgi:hypothetical protein
VGLARVEAALLRVFPSAIVFLGGPEETTGTQLRNAILVAGPGVEAGSRARPTGPVLVAALEYLQSSIRPARPSATAATDDWSDLDYVDADVRALFRLMAMRVTPQVVSPRS